MTPPSPPDIICIGAVLWDIIGRSEVPMHSGADMPGRITRLPGGVAMNVALTMRRFGLTPTMLTAIGTDPSGDELIAACGERGIQTDHVYRTELPTDRYLAVEDSSGLIAAIADAHSLEAAGARILTPLTDGRLGSAEQPWRGLIALDGNLTESLLGEIAASPYIAAADVRVAPASPGKVERLRPLLAHPRVTLYLNLEEAGLLCAETFGDSAIAAHELLERGARRVLVTDGPRACSDGQVGQEIISASPPHVRVNRVTGAGDTFMAAHIVGERAGLSREEALTSALRAAAKHVSGNIGS